MTSKTTSKRLKVFIEIPFGPFRSMEDASLLKKRVKARVPATTFTAITKSKIGYAFKGHLTYVKSFTVPASAVKQVLLERMPAAKISVKAV
jgi:hypothetical protein